MEKFMRNIKNVITKRNFLAKLSEEYGSPQEVRDHLLALTKENPWLLVFFGKDIIRLDEEVQRASAEEEDTLRLMKSWQEQSSKEEGLSSERRKNET